MRTLSILNSSFSCFLLVATITRVGCQRSGNDLVEFTGDVEASSTTDRAEAANAALSSDLLASDAVTSDAVAAEHQEHSNASDAHCSFSL